MREKKEAELSKVIRTLGIGNHSVDAILVRSPLKFLSDAINKKRYLEGVCVGGLKFNPQTQTYERFFS